MKRNKSVKFVLNFQCQASFANTKPPIEDFPATVLPEPLLQCWWIFVRGLFRKCFSCVKRNFWLAKSLTSRHLRMRRVIFQVMHFASGGC